MVEPSLGVTHDSDAMTTAFADRDRGDVGGGARGGGGQLQKLLSRKAEQQGVQSHSEKQDDCSDANYGRFFGQFLWADISSGFFDDLVGFSLFFF